MSKRIISRRGRRGGGALLWPALLALALQVACAPLTPQPGTGATSTPLPSLEGLDQHDAKQLLDQMGFVVDTEQVGPDGLTVRFGNRRNQWPPPDTVIGRLPADERLLPGTIVTLLIARYESEPAAVFMPQVAVPDVSALSLDAAARQLKQAGFRIRSSFVGAAALAARFGAASGLWPPSNAVISQTPTGGSMEDGDSVVSVEVARWSLDEVSLGQMTGRSQAAAVKRLEAAGYRVVVKPRAPTDFPDARIGDVLAARVIANENGQNVAQLTVANADGRNVRSPALLDADRDGVPDARDRCADTPRSASVDAEGCPQEQKPVDRDGDGVPDQIDECPATVAGVTVNARGCEFETLINDADGDGVPDHLDLCPDSPAGSLGAPQGCTLTQRVNRLPEGLYAFNRQSVMEVGRPEAYKVVLVLDPRGSSTPGDVEARVLSELPAGDRPPQRDIAVIDDAGDDCTPPVVCFREKYYEKMRVDLRVDQDGWEIRPDNPVEVRAVVSDRVTRWGWTVTPACDGGGLLSGECRPAELTLDAYAMFDDASYGPIMVFNEKITVEVSTDERVASFFERYRMLIAAAVVFAVLLAIAAWWLARRRHGGGPPAAPFEAVSVLFVGANPRGTSRIRLDEEVRGIDQSIRLGERRDAFTLHQHWAARVSDLDDALMRYRPNIVHISAHGTQDGELLLEGGEGTDGKVSAAQLEKLFAILTDDIRLVVLNACFSEEQARLVVNHVDCVVGMSDAVNDKVAQRFSESFYLALANGRSVQIAFELASAEVNGDDQRSVPRLLALRSDPNRVEFARRAPTRHIDGVNT